MKDTVETRKQMAELIRRYRHQNDEPFSLLADGYEALLESVRSYEEGITWETTCLGCAKLYSQLYDQDCRIDQIRTLVGCKLPHVPEEGFPEDFCEEGGSEPLRGRHYVAKFWSGEVRVDPLWAGSVEIQDTSEGFRMVPNSVTPNPFPGWEDPQDRVFFLYSLTTPVAEGTVVERSSDGALWIILRWL